MCLLFVEKRAAAQPGIENAPAILQWLKARCFLSRAELVRLMLRDEQVSEKSMPGTQLTNTPTHTTTITTKKATSTNQTYNE